MSAKKAVRLSTLSFSDLQDKAKEIENYKALNRFEVTAELRKGEKCPCSEGLKNPREIKPEIKELKAKLAETTDKKARLALRRTIGQKKRATRKYL